MGTFGLTLHPSSCLRRINCYVDNLAAYCFPMLGNKFTNTEPYVSGNHFAPPTGFT